MSKDEPLCTASNKRLILSLSKDEASLLHGTTKRLILQPVEGWRNAIHFAGAMNFHVYIVECSDGSYYVGLARLGLERRVGEHNDGIFRGYTFSRRPVKLVWSEDFDRLTDAIACERRLKGWRREKKQALIAGNYDALPQLARTAKTPRPSTSSG